MPWHFGSWLMNRAILFLIDLCLIAFATLAALAFHEDFEVSLRSVQSLLPYLGATLTVAALVLSSFGLNRSIWHMTAMTDYLRVAAAALVTVLAAMAIGFITNRLEGVARSLPVLQAVLIVCALVGARVLTRLVSVGGARDPSLVELLTLPRSARAHETVLVVGLDG